MTGARPTAVSTLFLFAGAALVSSANACSDSKDGAAGAGASGNGGAAGTPQSASGGKATAGGSSATGGTSAAGGAFAGGAVGGAASATGGTAGSSTGGASSGGKDGSGAGGSAGAVSGGATNSGGRAASSGGTSNGGSSSTATGGSGGGTSDRCDIASQSSGTEPQALTLSGNLGTHDPVAIFAHGQYYLFSTGNGIGAKTSSNLREWKAAPAVFASNPSWIEEQVPGASNLWAPDISYFGGYYHLYYSASTFGSNRSCIGHATRAALNAGSWTDHGSVVCSNPNGGSSDDWNAIDPNVIVDQAGVPWLAFGSFWGGLKLLELDASGARANDEIASIAARPSDSGALEAPFIVRRCGYYYLFVSFDACCKGVDSTYRVMVGRATSVTGPYSDREGQAMMQGGGTEVLVGTTRWRGPGHNAVVFDDAGAYNLYHSYDANNGGDPMLRVSELVWDEEGWPVSGGP